MSKNSRRVAKNKNLVTSLLYTKDKGIHLLKASANANFIETAEVHMSLGLEPKYADQQLRATVILPKGTGKVVKIAVVTKSNKVQEALQAGADIADEEDLIEKISKGHIEFDQLIATPDIMPSIARLGKVLGPRGLMPSPKAGTVTSNLAEAIKEFKAGKIEYRVDKTGIVHIPFGKVNFSDEDLLINLNAVCDSINKNRPPGAKGKYWKSLYICSTMGPSINIELDSLK